MDASLHGAAVGIPPLWCWISNRPSWIWLLEIHAELSEALRKMTECNPVLLNTIIIDMTGCVRLKNNKGLMLLIINRMKKILKQEVSQRYIRCLMHKYFRTTCQCLLRNNLEWQIRNIMNNITDVGDIDLNESALYKQLGVLTKDKSKWEENIPYVTSMLDHEAIKIQAKALWLLGEMGLEYPDSIQDAVSSIVAFCESGDALLKERAVNALGRIGRGNYSLIEPYWIDLFRFASDEEPKVRLSFIWASENIATNTPDIYENYMHVFEKLLHDEDDKVRMESPEIFRVLGKRRPEFVIPYIEQLQKMAELDSNRVVRIHSLGAINAASTK